MGKNKITIDDVKKNKIKLEKDITKLLFDFEKTNGIRLGYIDIQRKRNKKDEAIEVTNHEKPKDIQNVDIRMELDLIY